MFRSPFPMILALSALALGCEKQQPPKVTAREVEKKVAEAAGSAADYARQEKDEYVAGAERAVDEARARIDELKTKAGTASAGLKGKLRRQIQSMEARRRLAQRKLDELKSASGEAWKDLRTGVDEALQDLKPAARARSPSSAE